MQKLSENPDRKKGQCMHKEKEPSLQKKETLPFFSSEHWIENTYIFLSACGRPHIRFMRHTGLPFH